MSPGNAYVGLGFRAMHPAFCRRHVTLCCPLGQGDRHACGYETDRNREFDTHLLTAHDPTPEQAWKWLSSDQAYIKAAAGRPAWPGWFVDGQPVYGHQPTYRRIPVVVDGRRYFDTLVVCSCGGFQAQEQKKYRATWQWKDHVRETARETGGDQRR